MTRSWEAWAAWLAALGLLLAGCSGLQTGGSPEALAGRWALATFEEGTPLDGVQVTIEFEPTGELRGDSGCNQYQGQFSVRGSALEIGPLAVTEMACLEPRPMEVEQAYLEALSRVATFERKGDALTLLDADGTPLLTFRPLE